MTWTYAANVLDLEPRGPLPTEIYWRRRGLAVGVAVVVLGIVVAAVIAFMGHNTGAKPASADKPNSAQSKPGSPAPQAPPPAAPGEQPNPGVPPQQGQNPEMPTPTAAVQPPPVLKEGDDCPDSTLAVKGLTNAPQYFIGDQPKFTMVVTNIGLVSCKRDVGAAVLAAYVYSLDNKRLWSNLDCAPSNETLIKTFTPGEQVTTAVTWTGMGSAPHCPLPRPAIGPGTYNLVVQLGNLRSQPVPFIMNQPPPPPGPAPGPGQPAAAPPPEAPPVAPAPAG
ncbi:hypothetical protein A5756_18415 [Mycobacterium sp. 852002-53434_SCH5985345]|nr:hypothetical protein A5756_18415 [Mycobacterium sp. 852002-53434_SCH5985345]OBF72125.1 hypothetical protein A5750_18460 [Mycobacterium sp. 852002-51613_SCH5001154]OBF94628.1 hypothetical protein A5773_15430 [Mycobacterium sp. 852014-52450_SCH5900713]